MLIQSQKIEFRKTRDFGEVLNASFFFIRQNFKPLLLNLFFIAGPFILVGSVIPGLLIYPWIGSHSTDSFGGVAFSSMIVNILSFFLGSLMAVGTIYEYMLLYMKNWPSKIQTQDVWKALRKDFFNLLLTLTGLTFLLGGGFGLIAYLTTVTIGIFWGVFLIFIGSIYLSVTLSFVIIMRLTEEVNFFEAIYRCFKLIEGKWWQTCGLFFICYIIQWAIITIIFIPFSILSATESLLSPAGTPSLSTSLILVTLAGIVLVLAVTLSFCLMLIVIAFQYFNLTERKESTGLLERIKNMGEPASTSADTLEEESY